MILNLESMIVGAIVGALLASGMWMLFSDSRGQIALTKDVATLIISEARAECGEKDRPFKIEGAGAYVTAGCGRQ